MTAHTLHSLLDGVDVAAWHGPTDATVTHVTYDSRRVEPGSLFVALVGAEVDGHDYLDAAVGRGASAIMVERAAEKSSVPAAVVEDTRATLALVADRFYNSPTRALDVVAITGTNGKTTVSYLLDAVLAHTGATTARIGTTGVRIADGDLVPLANTTPESLDLQSLLRQAVAAGCSHAVIEASSHGLATHRLDGCRFAARTFTNLSRDHLDFHGSMEAYFQAKRRLFTAFESGAAVLNVDDEHGARLAAELPEAVTFSVDSASDAQVRPEAPPTLSAEGTRLVLTTPSGPCAIDSPMVGAPNLENLIAAATTAMALGLAPADVGEALSASVTVPGRLQRVADVGGGRLIFVDYAHTPDALERTLAAMRSVAPARVAVVFGAGGDRDRGKRPHMGAAAAHADGLFLTSDNPRTEDPAAIMADIVAGVPANARGRVREIADRRTAIAAALQWAQPSDLILIAGKGHEPYQEIGRVRHPFDDVRVCRSLLTEATP